MMSEMFLEYELHKGALLPHPTPRVEHLRKRSTALRSKPKGEVNTRLANVFDPVKSSADYTIQEEFFVSLI